MIGIWTITGNPLLKPEVSHNFNLSVEYVKGNYGFVVAGYCNRVTNKITSGNPYYASATETMPRLPYVNIDRLYVAGFEATRPRRVRGGVVALMPGCPMPLSMSRQGTRMGRSLPVRISQLASIL